MEISSFILVAMNLVFYLFHDPSQAQDRERRGGAEDAEVPLNKGGRGLFLSVLCGFKSIKPVS